MELQAIVVCASLTLLFTYLAYKLLFSKPSLKNLPPAPPSLPILGHLHFIKPPIHRALQSLSLKYGPIMLLKFGSRNVLIVSSSKVAEECFTKNDIVLADRPKLILSKHVSYNHSTMLSAPYGDHWRNLRRIGSVEIFSNHRLNLFLSTRTDEIKHLLKKLSHSSSEDRFTKVTLRPLLTDLTLNNIMRMVAGKRYYGDGVENEEEAGQFKEIMTEVFKHGGASNTEDFLPLLNWVTLGRYKRLVKGLAKRTDTFLQGLIDEHRNKKDGVELNTMIDHLLSLQESQQSYYTDEIIKGLVLILLLAGTDTSAVTIEWAMSNLVNHPEILRKARRELDSEIGEDRLIVESDVPKLHCLHNIIQETMRLYPAAPLLVPHNSSDNCTIGGYNVPSDTMVLVNAWAIHRDPTIWEDPLSFNPDRYASNTKMGDYKFMPFGMGRRACPGATLAQRLVGLTLGSLIQCFEWERVGEENVDMTEGEGLSMPKAIPLEIMCKALPIAKKFLS